MAPAGPPHALSNMKSCWILLYTDEPSMRLGYCLTSETKPNDGRAWFWVPDFQAWLNDHKADHDARMAEISARQAAENQSSAEELFNQKIAQGYLDPITNITLKCTDSAQQRFTALVTTLREQLDAGEINNSFLVKFGDINDQFQTLSIADFRALMRRYAKYCMVLFSAEMSVDAGQVTSAEIVSPTWWQTLISLLLD